jgi:Fe/S biogenesis protein NfuA
MWLRLMNFCMSSTAEAEDTLREEIGEFLQRNFPQIEMHGGPAAIEQIDRDTGEVTIQLGGACSGCGISPMTIQAIKKRMANEIEEIETVHANTGGDGDSGHGDAAPSFPGETSDDTTTDTAENEGPTAPF